MKDVRLVLGTMTFGESVFMPDVREFIKVFLEAGYTELDTAYVYNDGECERLLGEALKGISGYKISTKVNPRITGKLDADAAYMQLAVSLDRLGLRFVDTFYLHFPDPDTPIDSVLEACGRLHEEGKFKELGLSNFPAWLVADVRYRCEKNGYVVPTVYEGIYNPLTRRAESELNKALDTYGIRFYAYNPLAGGILTGRYSGFEDAPDAGRFVNRPNYKGRYWKKSYFEAVEMLAKACVKAGIKLTDAVFRYLMHHSMLSGERGDAVIIGASGIGHLRQNIEAAKAGPLPEEMVQVFEDAWTHCRADSPEYYTWYKKKPAK